MKIKSSIQALAAISAFAASSAQAALLIGLTPITLNFNNLNTNFGGAYNSSGGSSAFPINTTTGTAPIVIYSGSGGTEFTVSTNDFNPGGVYSNTAIYSNSNSVRALQDAATSDLAIGVKDSNNRSFTLSLQNNTGSNVSAWDIGYDIEQYSKGASPTTFSFSYSTDGTTFVTTNLTGASAVTADNSAPVDMNLATVLTTSRTGTVNQPVADGSPIFFRWSYTHNGGTSVHMGIDNITVATVPEPAATVLGALGFLSLLRRRR